MQPRTQKARAVRPEASEGVLERTELKVLTRTRRVVRRRPQRAGWEERGRRKLTEETPTIIPGVKFTLVFGPTCWYVAKKQISERLPSKLDVKANHF